MIDEARKKLAEDVFTALRTQYARQFLSQFQADGATGDLPTVRDWKNTLYRQLRGFQGYSVMDALDNLMVRNPEFPPSIPQLRAEATRLDRDEAHAAENSAMLARMREEPSPIGLDRISQLQALAASLRASRPNSGAHMGGDDAAWAKMKADHGALVAPYSRAGQALAMRQGGGARFRDADYRRQRDQGRGACGGKS